MPKKTYTRRLTLANVRQLFREGVYYLGEDNQVISKRTKKPLFQYTNQTPTGTPYVRLFSKDAYGCFAISRIIWTVATGEDIPKGWEVHHRDGNPLENDFNNLLCLHPVDHKKVHTEADEIPF